MTKKILVTTLIVYFLLIESCCMGAETIQSMCCTNPYHGCEQGNGADEGKCNSYCSDGGCRGGECKNWGIPGGACHCYC